MALIGFDRATILTDGSPVSPAAYVNPLTVIVEEAPLKPDSYESNNLLVNATVLPVVFGTNAIACTNGANIHSTADYDIYRVTLPRGVYI
jgi:hypothetical protein